MAGRQRVAMKVLVNHNRGCRCIGSSNGRWPWIGGVLLRTDHLRYSLVWSCSDPECKAELSISIFAIFQAIPAPPGGRVSRGR